MKKIFESLADNAKRADTKRTPHPFIRNEF
jgi:hypothetical protein